MAVCVILSDQTGNLIGVCVCGGGCPWAHLMECLLWLGGFECKHRCRHAVMLIFVRMCHSIVPRAVCFLTPRAIQDMKQDTAKQDFYFLLWGIYLETFCKGVWEREWKVIYIYTFHSVSPTYMYSFALLSAHLCISIVLLVVLQEILCDN